MDGRLIVVEGGRNRIHDIFDDVLVVGSGAEVSLRLHDPKVAPAHCEIRRMAHGFKLVDLETTAGTLVNDHSVNQHFLKDGDVIKIGGARITYHGISSADTPPARPVPKPLTKLPVDDDGRPKRFYRHEGQRRPESNTVKIVIGLAVAVTVVLVAITLFQNKESELTQQAEREHAWRVHEDAVQNVLLARNFKEVFRLLAKAGSDPVLSTFPGRIQALRTVAEKEYRPWAESRLEAAKAARLSGRIDDARRILTEIADSGRDSHIASQARKILAEIK